MAKLIIRWKESGVLVIFLCSVTLFLLVLLRSVSLSEDEVTDDSSNTNSKLQSRNRQRTNFKLIKSPTHEYRQIKTQTENSNIKSKADIIGSQNNEGNQQLAPLEIPLTHSPEKVPTNISIATAVCSRFGDGGPLMKSTIMIKSVLVSAKLYNIPKVDIYLFLEYREDELLYQQKFKEFGYKDFAKVINIQYRYVQDAIPAKFQKHMLYSKKSRCNFAKIFLPTSLPNVDSVLYLDIDTIVVGNPVEIWKYFYKMNAMQLVGLTKDHEPEYPLGLNEYLQAFGGTPHPLPKGLSTGVLLMNLTRMRDFRWEEKLLQVFKDHQKALKKLNFQMNDQRTINILLYYADYLFYVLPCNFNFKSTHCAQGAYCKDATTDPIGIQVVHGIGSQFDLGASFYDIYKAYEKVTLKNPTVKNLKKSLLTPIRQAYAHSKPKLPGRKDSSRHQRSKCYKSINKLLYKEFFP